MDQLLPRERMCDHKIYRHLLAHEYKFPYTLIRKLIAAGALLKNNSFLNKTQPQMRQVTCDESIVSSTGDRHSFSVTRLQPPHEPFIIQQTSKGYSEGRITWVEPSPSPGSASIDFINRFLHKNSQLCTQRPVR